MPAWARARWLPCPKSRAEDRSAKGHFQLAKEQFQDAKLALESGDVNDAVRHTVRGVTEGLQAAGAQVQADKHETAAWKDLARYHDKMGHDPEQATRGCRAYTPRTGRWRPEDPGFPLLIAYSPLFEGAQQIRPSVICLIDIRRSNDGDRDVQ